MSVEEQIEHDFSLLEAENEIIDCGDLMRLCATHWDIDEETVKKWVAKQSIMEKLKTTYVGAQFMLMRVK